MKTIKDYTAIILQAIFLLAGILIVSSLSAREAEPGAEAYKNSIETTMEEELEVETWMLKPESWIINASLIERFNEVDEDEIALECWMTDANHSFWDAAKEAVYQLDDELVLENWMTDINYIMN